MKIIVASMVRNEADRFWRSALDAWSEFADEIVVLDDNSEDETPEIAEEAGTAVYPVGNEVAAWGNESNARAYLFKLATSELVQAGEDTVVLWLDADMVPARDPRDFFESSEADAFAFALFDLWASDPLRYRSDDLWQGHLRPRVWAVRVKEDFFDREWSWSERGIHCGHLPKDFAPEYIERVAFAPQDYSLTHWGYISDDLRREKVNRYADVADQLSDFERRHAASIVDEDPHLEVLPFSPKYTLKRL